MTLDKKIKQLEEAQKSINKTVLDIVKDYEAEVLDLNTDAQLFDKGIDSDGQSIQPGYRGLTISIKGLKGQPTNRVTLRDTGDFHRSFDIEYFKDSFAIFATDSKTKKLERKYGKAITGLTAESIKELREIMNDDLFESIKKQIQ